jgi:hypothetical protein
VIYLFRIKEAATIWREKLHHVSPHHFRNGILIMPHSGMNLDP